MLGIIVVAVSVSSCSGANMRLRAEDSPTATLTPPPVTVTIDLSPTDTPLPYMEPTVNPTTLAILQTPWPTRGFSVSAKTASPTFYPGPTLTLIPTATDGY